ncbi:hypothetical protein [Fructobacillus durionis]|uniref:hypothetical protein n=1 Tax=Fructobacillus durionis TaxID=283737 RepID=UPI000B843936|nr:hypothetical protein [Fructobacillus durionis]
MKDIITGAISAVVALGTAYFAFSGKKQDSMNESYKSTLQVLEDLREDCVVLKEDCKQLREDNEELKKGNQELKTYINTISSQYTELDGKFNNMKLLMQEMCDELKKHGKDYSKRIEKIS